MPFVRGPQWGKDREMKRRLRGKGDNPDTRLRSLLPLAGAQARANAGGRGLLALQTDDRRRITTHRPEEAWRDCPVICAHP